MKKVVCFDFDGVLHRDVFDPETWVAEEILGEPIPEGIELLKSTLTRFHVVILSARSSRWQAIAAMERWLEDQGVDMACVLWTRYKPPGAVYLDDNALRFPADHAALLEAMQ